MFTLTTDLSSSALHDHSKIVLWFWIWSNKSEHGKWAHIEPVYWVVSVQKVCLHALAEINVISKIEASFFFNRPRIHLSKNLSFDQYPIKSSVFVLRDSKDRFSNA